MSENEAEHKDNIENTETPPVDQNEEQKTENVGYNITNIAHPLREDEINRKCACFYTSFGFESQKLFNLFAIDDNTILYGAGNTVQIQNLVTKEIHYIFGIDGGGIGAVALHPSHRYFACCERGTFPNVYIYGYPMYNIYKILKKGTERAYNCANFNKSGDKLATIGSYPDFLLTVWDWEKEQIIQKCKAFSQDIYNIQFSPRGDGFLASSGVGHIRFWQMARTFTGLKLQGEIGKFGKVELSDIHGFAELHDGKVLSGTEKGVLLLWDGNFIKCEIYMDDGYNPHNGIIYVVLLYNENGNEYFITSGEDGYIRWWKYEDVNQAEITDDRPRIDITPYREIYLGDDICVVSMVHCSNFWLIQNACGSVLKLTDKEMEEKDSKPEIIWEFHGSHVKGIDCAPNQYYMASTGSDGTVRVWNYYNRREITSNKYTSVNDENVPYICDGTSLKWIPKALCPIGNSFVVGFINGIIRILSIYNDQLKLSDIIKPHNAEVTHIEFNATGNIMATTSRDGKLWLFIIEKSDTKISGIKCIPWGFISFDYEIYSIEWHKSENKFLIGCSRCHIYEITLNDIPSSAGISGNRTSYTIEDYTKREYTFKGLQIKNFTYENIDTIMTIAYAPEGGNTDSWDGNKLPPPELTEEEKQQKEEEEKKWKEEHPDTPMPEPEIPVEPVPDFLVGVSNNEYNSRLYKCKWDEEYAVGFFESPSAISFLKVSNDEDFVFCGDCNGRLRIRSKKCMKYYSELCLHDGDNGRIRNIIFSFDNNFMITSSDDGEVVVTRFSPEIFNRELNACMMFHKDYLKRNPVNNVIVNFDDLLTQQQYEYGNIQQEPEIVNNKDITGLEEPEEITNDSYYSIEQAKLKKEEEERMTEADKHKKYVREQIEHLRTSFEDLRRSDMDDNPEMRLTAQDYLNIEDDYWEELKAEGEEMCNEVNRMMEWISLRRKMEFEKVRDYYLKQLYTEGFSVKAFKTGLSVRSLRTISHNEKLLNIFKSIHDEQERINSQSRDSMAIKSSNKNQNQRGGSPTKPKWQPRDPNKITSAERRKMMRLERKARLNALLDKQPNKEDYLPEDVKAVETAALTIGDYKLKSAPNYIVPKEVVLNAKQKYQELCLREESLQQIRIQYNDRILKLRNTKETIINEMKIANERLKDISEKIGEQIPLYEIPDTTDDWPEKRENYTQEELIGYKEQHAPKKEIIREEDRLTVLPPSQAAPPSSVNNAVRRVSQARRISRRSRVSNSQLSAFQSPRVTIQMEPYIPKLPTTFLPYYDYSLLKPSYTDDEKEREKLKLIIEKGRIIKYIDGTIELFDNTITQLREDRYRLESDLLSAEIYILILYEEFRVLKAFESSDITLAASLNKNTTECKSITHEIEDCQGKLDEKMQEMEAWKEKDEELMKEFNNIISDSKTYEAQLLKIYKRKIKRNKKKEVEENNNGDDDDDSDSDSDYSDLDLDFSDDDDSDNEEMCPAGCDQAVYEGILDLREKRLDQEDILAEHQKEITDLKRVHDRLIAKQKTLIKALDTTNQQIAQVQKEKQQQLNEVMYILSLKLDQICISYKEIIDENNEDGNVTENNTVSQQNSKSKSNNNNNNNEDNESEDSNSMKEDNSISEGNGEEEEDGGGEREDTFEVLKLPADLSTCLLFSNRKIDDLHNRIEELKQENINLSKSYQDLHKEQSELTNKKKLIEAEIAGWEEKNRDLQMLKFGQIIDFDLLDAQPDHREEDAFKQMLHAQEAKNNENYAKYKKQLKHYQQMNLSLTEDNTTYLRRIAELTNDQFTLEKQLNSVGSGVHVADQEPMMRREQREKEKLIQLVKLQSKEVDALKIEITMLRRKGGNIYTTVTPNIPYLPQDSPYNDSNLYDGNISNYNEDYNNNNNNYMNNSNMNPINEDEELKQTQPMNEEQQQPLQQYETQPIQQQQEEQLPAEEQQQPPVEQPPEASSEPPVPPAESEPQQQPPAEVTDAPSEELPPTTEEETPAESTAVEQPTTETEAEEVTLAESTAVEQPTTETQAEEETPAEIADAPSEELPPAEGEEEQPAEVTDAPSEELPPETEGEVPQTEEQAQVEGEVEQQPTEEEHQADVADAPSEELPPEEGEEQPPEEAVEGEIPAEEQQQEVNEAPSEELPPATEEEVPAEGAGEDQQPTDETNDQPEE